MLHDSMLPNLTQTPWLHQLYMQAPMAIGIYLGDQHIIEFANPKMCEVWGRTAAQVINKPLFQALPEVAGQGFEEILAEVLSSGESFVGNELPAPLERKGKLELAYFSFIYQPLRNAQEEIIGVVQVANEVTDLVKARQKAERNEEILNMALESGKLGTWYEDFILGTTIRSVEYDRIFGYKEPVTEWNQQIFLSHVLPDDQTLAEQHLQQALQNGKLNVEVRVQWPDLSIHWVHIKGETGYNAKGQPISTSGVIMDITERKQSSQKERQLAVEQAARQEAERQGKMLHTLFMDAPAMICTLLGPHHKFDLINPLYQQLFRGRQLKGLPLMRALPELEGQPFKQILDKVYQTGEAFIGNEIPLLFDRLNTGELTTGYFNFVYQAMRDAQGVIIGILVFAFEVTEQLLARKEIETSQESLNLALEAGKMGTWNLDLRTDTSSRSLQHDQLYGYETLLPSWGSQQFIEHIVPADRALVEAAFQQAKQSGELYFEARIQRTDGQYRWIATKGQVFYEEQHPIRMAGVSLDITQPKEVENKLQKLTEEMALINQELALANKEIQASNQQLLTSNKDILAVNQQLTKVNADLDMFVYAASHDLKSPITSLQALLALLAKRLDGKLNQKEQELLQMIEASSIRLQRTIKDLTQVAKVQRNTEEEKEMIHFHDLLEDIKADLQSAIIESGAQLSVEFGVPTIFYARQHARSILYNLLSNAIKYHSDRTPHVTLTTQLADQHVVLTVKDNGLGLTPSQQQNLFTMFKRFHNHVEGSGVGLYMIKRMVENNGGEVQVESHLGEGSTFNVFF